MTEAIDTTSAGGKLTFYIFGALAEFERSLIRERSARGIYAVPARISTYIAPPMLFFLQMTHLYLVNDLIIYLLSGTIGVRQVFHCRPSREYDNITHIEIPQH